MKINKPINTEKSAGFRPRCNITIVVSGYEKDTNGISYVVGKNISNGQSVRATLTQTGHKAEIPNRPSIDTLKNGFKTGRNRYALVPGGVVSIGNAMQDEKGDWVGDWPNVLAYSPEDAKNYMGGGRHVLLRMSVQSPSGKVSGTVNRFDEEKIKVVDRDGIAAAIESLVTHYVNPAFMIRALNKNGEVVDYTLPICRNNEPKEAEGSGRIEWVAKTPAKIGQDVSQIAISSLNTKDVLQYNRLPSEQYIVSPIALRPDDRGRSSAGTFLAQEKSFYRTDDSDEREYYAKEAYFKTGGDTGIMVSALHATQPYSDGIDPVLIGGLRYMGQEQNTTADTDSSAAADSDDPEQLFDFMDNDEDYGPRT
jgi:hypothetical protein